MSITLFEILKILGSLAFFIYGMKVMSEGIQRAAGSQMRQFLRRMTKNRFIGFLTGLFITALVQSSSATTVMTISFVNAGLLTLLESAGIIIGANVGTTITGWLIALGIDKFSLAEYALPFVAFGLPLLLIRRGRYKSIGESILGFAIILLGLSFLKTSFPDLEGNSEAFEFLSAYTNLGFLTNLGFVLVGALLTAAIQSSSASMALTLVMSAKGWIPFEVAAAMVLGGNLGTTITAELASLVGNVFGKRSARIHTLFNLIGVAWMVILLPWAIQLLDNILTKGMGMTSAFDSPSNVPYAIAAFHTSFNLLNAFLLIGFVPYLVKMVEQTVGSRGEDDEAFRLEYIESLVKTPELSIVEVQKALTKYGEVTSRMSGFVKSLLFSIDKKEQITLLSRIQKYEEITDNYEIELTNYLTKITLDEISPKTSIKIRGMMNICGDLERIGDVFYQISKTIEKKNEENIWFNQSQREQLTQMFDFIDIAFNVMIENLKTEHYSDISLEPALEAEQNINRYRDKLRQESKNPKGKEAYNINSALIYNNIFSSLERIGDHIINVTEAAVGEV